MDLYILYKQIIFIFLCITQTIFCAHYYEANCFADILQYIKSPKKTLVVCDIDNTLIEPAILTGSDQWFYAVVEQEKKHNRTDKNIYDRLLPLYFTLQHTIPLKTIELETPAILNILQSQGVHLVALTVRSIPIAHVTVDTLAQLAINFSSSFPLFSNHLSDSTFLNGIIFCQRKGAALTEF